MLRHALAIGAASLALSAPASAAAPHPVLSVKGRHAFTVTGRHFHARERVRVVLAPARRGHVRHVRASARGTFTVRFRDVPAGPCEGYAIVATGSRGSRATLMRMHPDCIVR